MRFQAVLLGIVFILVLSLISYYASSFVTRPVQDSINILRTFVADASHELNTPISILQDRMEALGVRLERLGIEAEEIRVSEKVIERLDKLISDLLLLSEVEAPLPTISKAPLDAGALVKEVVDQIKERYLEKNVDLHSTFGRIANQRQQGVIGQAFGQFYSFSIHQIRLRLFDCPFQIVKRLHAVLIDLIW